MSGTRTLARLGSSSRSVSRRCMATQSAPTAQASNSEPTQPSRTPTTLFASLLLSRPPLLTPTPTQLESTYHKYTTSLQHAISNPASQTQNFYFKSGSLPLRRFQASNHAYELSTYGSKIAGKAPELGDIPAETPVVEIARDEWEKKDSARGEKSLERQPEGEVFLLVKGKDSKWGFPRTQVAQGESLEEAVGRIRGVRGQLGGEGMDSWLVTKKPIGSISSASDITFFLRSHILAGEPKPSGESGCATWAWLTPSEIEERLRSQGDEATWERTRRMFGVSSENDE